MRRKYISSSEGTNLPPLVAALAELENKEEVEDAADDTIEACACLAIAEGSFDEEEVAGTLVADVSRGRGPVATVGT